MLKELLHRVLCRFGWHDWEEVPEERREDIPGLIRSYTNARCQRCLVRSEINWMSHEMSKEELREAVRELRESLYPPPDSVG